MQIASVTRALRQEVDFVRLGWRDEGRSGECAKEASHEAATMHLSFLLLWHRQSGHGQRAAKLDVPADP
jgi:hypothetical protein